MKNRKYQILAILWMIVIFYLSHQPANISSAQSGTVIELLKNMPFIGSIISYMLEIEIAEFVIRKSAHMFAYFVLAILFFKAMYKGIDIKKVYTKAFIFTFLYACTDEIHQLFIPGRSGEFRDVLVDSTGALIGLLVIYIIRKSQRKK